MKYHLICIDVYLTAFELLHFDLINDYNVRKKCTWAVESIKTTTQFQSSLMYAYLNKRTLLK